MKRVALVLALAILAVPSDAVAAPTIEFSCTPAPSSCDGWYRQPVTVTWDWSPDSAIAQPCDIAMPVDFDTTGVTRSCKVTDGNASITAEVSLKVDMTAPLVTAAVPGRQPDSNGWFRAPVQVAFSGTDATSGLLGCTTATYSGPDGSATVGGTCTDKAGNVSGPTAFGLRYDATAPSLEIVRAAAGDQVVRLRWAVSGAAAVEVWRSPGVNGADESRLEPGARGLEDERVRNGRRYDYRVRAVDEAGNAATRVYSIVPGPRLIAPATGARAGSPPLLRWTKVRGARYYNVQLLHDGRKVLSAWPTRPWLQLKRSWRFSGDRHKLEPGRYRWLVWPGRGPRSENDYGPLIGRRSFTVG